MSPKAFTILMNLLRQLLKMLKLAVYASDRTPTEFDVSSFRGVDSNPVSSFDFSSRGVVRITALAGGNTLDSDIDTDSIWYHNNTLNVRFADLNLPVNTQHTLHLSGYQFQIPEPLLLTGAYTYTRIVLVSLLEQ